MLELTPDHLETVLDHARAAYPEECCGLFVGEPYPGGARVREVMPAPNRHPEPRRRFDVDPSVLLAGHKRARVQGHEVVGYYHSHPDSPARPSFHDAAAALPQASYLIVRVDDGRPGEVRSFRAARAGAGLVEERVEVLSP